MEILPLYAARKCPSGPDNHQFYPSMADLGPPLNGGGQSSKGDLAFEKHVAKNLCKLLHLFATEVALVVRTLNKFRINSIMRSSTFVRDFMAEKFHVTPPSNRAYATHEDCLTPRL